MAVWLCGCVCLTPGGVLSPDADARQVLGLSSLVKRVLGKKLDKRQQLSNWEARPLSRMQVHYAALDAWCLLQLMEHALFRTPNPPEGATPHAEPPSQAAVVATTVPDSAATQLAGTAGSGVGQESGDGGGTAQASSHAGAGAGAGGSGAP